MFRVSEMSGVWYAASCDLEREEDVEQIEALLEDGSAVILVNELDDLNLASELEDIEDLDSDSVVVV